MRVNDEYILDTYYDGAGINILCYYLTIGSTPLKNLFRNFAQ